MIIESLASTDMAATIMPSTVERESRAAPGFRQHLEEVNRKIISAEDGLRSLALGEADNLHQVMITISKAKLSFDLAVQVRNRLVEGYQEIIRMGV